MTQAQIRQADAEADAAARRAYMEEQRKPDAGQQPRPAAEPLTNPDGTPTRAGWRRIGEELRKPMSTKERTGKGGLRFKYIDARQVQSRLDAVIGPGNWASDWSVVRADHPVCARVGISIFGVWKWDVGYSNNPEADEETDRSYEDEPLKAAVSDGFKRAAVQWGIGRWLYE